ncbi:MAG: hypothetical protein SWH61_17130 [Thermodesulfobacteriota bacterium]|nr:hypothetical protein [Thermodesulfobacteriota bacterium]
MNWQSRSILLEKEDTWSLRVFRIFIDNKSLLDTTKHFPRRDSVIGQLIMSVFRDQDIT